jgi:RimJ/RimL family protein N-acetyltransferase
MQRDGENFSQKPNISFYRESWSLKVKIETENLYIYSYSEKDFEECVRLYGDEIVTKYFDHGKPRSRVEVENYIAEKGNKHFNKGEPFGLFSIFDKHTGVFIGQVDLLPMGEPGVVEIGCILHECYHSMGIGTEAVRAMVLDYVEILNVDFKFNEHPIVKVIGTVHPDNILSRKLIKSLGMIFEKSQRRFDNPRLWYAYFPEKRED